ncbi:MAG: AI-2E family transporter [Clostridiales bacterium]|jgi:predicted PurR-regulated permease PerM|nr:AI-2E family transporter [Clostridiales bacterium]
MKRPALLIAIAIAAAALLFAARESLTPLFFGLAFAYLFSPAVGRLERSGVKRRSALVCVYAIAAALVFAVFWIGIPYLMRGISALQKTLSDYFGNISFEFLKSADGIASRFGAEIFGYIGGAATTLASATVAVVNAALGLALSFYMLLDREKILSALAGLVPAGRIPAEWRRFFANVLRSVDAVLRRFLLGQLGVAAVMSGLLFAGLAALGVRYALLLAVLAGVLEIIPYFGAFLGAVPAVAAALAQSPRKAVWTAVLFIAVQQLEGAYISPKILGDYVGLHPIVTIMAVIVGGRLFGVAGMLLAVPACGILRSVAGELIEALGGGAAEEE